MRTQSYPSDITDAQWAFIEPHLPVYPGGRPRKFADNKYHNHALYESELYPHLGRCRRNPF